MAVHGLASNPETTFRYNKSGPMWLKDFLPKEPSIDARIMVFNYNSAWLGKILDKSLEDHANDLLRSLRDNRSTAEVRLHSDLRCKKIKS